MQCIYKRSVFGVSLGGGVSMKTFSCKKTGNRPGQLCPKHAASVKKFRKRMKGIEP